MLFQRLNDPSFFSLKVLPAFAFRQFCVVIDPSTLPAAIYKEYVKYINGEEIGSYVGMELRMVDATNAQEEYDSGRILF